MTSRLLLVEPSATMRYVLENYAQSLDFGVVAIGDYAQAEAALHQQFRVYGSDFAGVLLGWPTVPDAEADSLFELLDSPDFQDLPVVVLSTDMRAATRAWVAGREHTAVLPWREYQGVDVLLRRLLNEPAAEGEVFAAKFDNRDIHVLIVDDSATIRFSLRDLFELQGYRVTLAGSHDEALEAARQTSFDIAILDFYLQDGTGDVLCRDLISDPATGELTCTILTGTYADHIIKRSLRAGAVECMFKNESHELLLARIDAISRFVRQRKRLAEEQRRLDRLVDTLAGATLLVDRHDTISYASAQAVDCLGYNHRDDLVGQEVEKVIDVQSLRQSANGNHGARWRDAAGQPLDVVYRLATLEGDEEVIVNFRSSPIVAVPANSDQLPTTPSGILEAYDLYEQAAPFVACLNDYLGSLDELPDLVSLLMINVFAERSDAPLQAIHEFDGLFAHVNKALSALHKREHHVTALKDNRFGFLLRHSSEPQAYLLTRKIMQLCNEINLDDDALSLRCCGCLLSLKLNEDVPAAALLAQAEQGLQLVNARGMNQALLLDLRRMLPVYASLAPAEA